MRYITSWSGGKDSTASIILERVLDLPPSDIFFVEVMFDKNRGISGELPEHINFVRNIAMPKFEQWGHRVTILRAEQDYLDVFNHLITRAKNPDHNGKLSGFVLNGKCSANRNLKMPPINKYLSSISDPYVQYIGIAADEPNRLARLGGNRKSLLADHNITEKMAYDICKQMGLLSPIYSSRKRGGCWFCPNQSIAQFAQLKIHYPQLWAELEQLSQTPNLVSYRFKYNDTFDDVAKAVDDYLSPEYNFSKFFNIF